LDGIGAKSKMMELGSKRKWVGLPCRGAYEPLGVSIVFLLGYAIEF